MSRKKRVEVIEEVPVLDEAGGVLDSAADLADVSVKKGGRFIKKLILLTILGLIAYAIYKMVTADNSPPQIDLAASYGSDTDTPPAADTPPADESTGSTT